MRITGRVQPGPPFSDLAVLAFANCLGCGAAAAVLLLTGSQFDWSKENWMKRIVLAARQSASFRSTIYESVLYRKPKSFRWQ
jgi:hypothetical protein